MADKFEQICDLAHRFANGLCNLKARTDIPVEDKAVCAVEAWDDFRKKLRAVLDADGVPEGLKR